MFGLSRHADINRLFNALLERPTPLVVSHGGVAVGSTSPNTCQAVQAAVQSGADVVKIDVSASSDGVFYAFHDGFEEELLGVAGRNIQSMSSWEIDRLVYKWVDRPGRPASVERLLALLSPFRGQNVLFALDRSWWRWPQLLKLLDGSGMRNQLLLKVPSWERDALRKLQQHPVGYATIGICSHEAEVQTLLGFDEVNVVGVELLASFTDSPWFDREVLADLRARGLATWVNSMTLTTGVPLFAGYDDERAIRQSPDAAWGPLVDLGFDAIQTALPWLLRSYLDERESAAAARRPLHD